MMMNEKASGTDRRPHLSSRVCDGLAALAARTEPQTLDEARALMWIRRACAYRTRLHCDPLNPQDADARLLSASVGFAPTDAGSRSGEDEL
jgi:hypothetical protein